MFYAAADQERMDVLAELSFCRSVFRSEDREYNKPARCWDFHCEVSDVLFLTLCELRICSSGHILYVKFAFKNRIPGFLDMLQKKKQKQSIVQVILP